MSPNAPPSSLPPAASSRSRHRSEKASAALLVALAAFNGGCGLIAVRTSSSTKGRGTTEPSAANSIPPSGRASAAPTANASDEDTPAPKATASGPLACEYGACAEAKSAYDRAMALIAAPDFDAAKWAEAHRHLRRCESVAESFVEVRRGAPAERRKSPLSTTCGAKADELLKRPVKGCGRLLISLTSLSTGGGHWTPVETKIDAYHDFYEPQSCEHMPKGDEVAADFRGLEARIRPLCKDAGAKLRFDDSWEHVPVGLGQVQRRAAVTCWVQGTRSDWLTEIKR